MLRNKSIWSLAYTASRPASSPGYSWLWLLRTKIKIQIALERVQWLFLGVNLTGSWDAQPFGQTSCLVCPWGCFCIRLTTELVDWVEQIVIPRWVGLVKSVAGLNRTERLTFLQLIGTLPAWLPLSWDIVFLLPSDLNCNISCS